MAIMAMLGQLPVSECQMSDRFFQKGLVFLGCEHQKNVDSHEHRSHEVVVRPSPSHAPILMALNIALKLSIVMVVSQF